MNFIFGGKCIRSQIGNALNINHDLSHNVIEKARFVLPQIYAQLNKFQQAEKIPS